MSSATKLKRIDGDLWPVEHLRQFPPYRFEIHTIVDVDKDKDRQAVNSGVVVRYFMGDDHVGTAMLALETGQPLTSDLKWTSDLEPHRVDEIGNHAFEVTSSRSTEEILKDVENTFLRTMNKRRIN